MILIHDYMPSILIVHNMSPLLHREFEELQQLADLVCLREYPRLLDDATLSAATSATPTCTAAPSDVPQPSELPPLIPGPPRRYVELYRSIAQRSALLVADWLRVGYVQGNMNSDNTLLGGRTLD